MDGSCPGNQETREVPARGRHIQDFGDLGIVRFRSDEIESDVRVSLFRTSAGVMRRRAYRFCLALGATLGPGGEAAAAHGATMAVLISVALLIHMAVV